MPNFQRRHYEAIAAVLRDAFDSARASGDLFAVDTLQTVTAKIGDVFTVDNPRFSSARFSAAATGSDASGR